MHKEKAMVEAKVLTEERKGEIALACLKWKLKEGGFKIDANFRRRIGNEAKQTGIPFAELLVFATGMAEEILNEVSEPTKPPTDDELAGFAGHGGH